MPDTDPVLIFDLDGTILRGNSFPRWALSMLSGRLRGVPWRARLRLAGRALWLLLRRKLGRGGHEALLLDLGDAWRRACGEAAPRAAEHFATRLLRGQRPELKPVLDRVARGEADAILATAASGEYAEAVGRALGFRHVLTSGAEGCNSGARKRDRVVEHLGRMGWSRRRLVFFTDHLDDLPLIRICHGVCWFGPERQLPRIREAAPNAAVMSGRQLNTTALSLAFGARQIYAARRARTAW